MMLSIMLLQCPLYFAPVGLFSQHFVINALPCTVAVDADAGVCMCVFCLSLRARAMSVFRGMGVFCLQALSLLVLALAADGDFSVLVPRLLHHDPVGPCSEP